MNGFVCLFNSGIDKSAPIKTIRQFINKADTCSACGTRCAQTSSANAASVTDFVAMMLQFCPCRCFLYRKRLILKLYGNVYSFFMLCSL